MSLAPAPFVTEAEFLSLPESNQKIELIDGEVIVPPSPEFKHQKISFRILMALGRWADQQQTPVTIAHAPLDVRFAPNRILQPDAMVFLAHIPGSQRGPIDRIPEICVEVLSTDRVYDRVTKRLVYAAAGVQEYWVVDANAFIERWRGSGLIEEEILRDRLATPLLPGFELDLPRLFAGLD